MKKLSKFFLAVFCFLAFPFAVQLKSLATHQVSPLRSRGRRLCEGLINCNGHTPYIVILDLMQDLSPKRKRRSQEWVKNSRILPNR